WYDRRLDAANSLIDYFARTATIASSAAPVFRATNLRITDQSFQPEFGRDATVSTSYMGVWDRTADAADATNFHFTWADNRLGGPDVRTAPVGIDATAPEVISTAPTGAVAMATSVDFVFNQAMNTTSFDPTMDVVSFTRNTTDI